MSGTTSVALWRCQAVGRDRVQDGMSGCRYQRVDYFGGRTLGAHSQLYYVCQNFMYFGYTYMSGIESVISLRAAVRFRHLSYPYSSPEVVPVLSCLYILL